MTTQTPIKMKRLSIDVPAELHRDLMRYCIDHDTKAADLLRNLIRQTVFKDTGAKEGCTEERQADCSRAM